MTRTSIERERLARRTALPKTKLDRNCRPLESNEYLLHVAADGTERRFTNSSLVPPKLKVTRVAVFGRFEKACTSNRERHEGAAMHIVPWPPLGEGWVIDDASHEKRTVWKRRID